MAQSLVHNTLSSGDWTNQSTQTFYLYSFNIKDEEENYNFDRYNKTNLSVTSTTSKGLSNIYRTAYQRITGFHGSTLGADTLTALESVYEHIVDTFNLGTWLSGSYTLLHINTIEIQEEGEMKLSIGGLVRSQTQNFHRLSSGSVSYTLNYDITPPILTLSTTDISSGDYTNESAFDFSLNFTEISQIFQ